MQMRPLGRSGLSVSLIGLGTMTWGEQNTEAEAFAQLDRAVDAGVNLIDVAEMYPVPPRAETQGATEAIVGRWLAARPGMRERVVLATKVAGPADWLPWIRGGPKLDADHIRRACEASLERLQTDVIDLYQVHWPARPTNFFGQRGYTHAPDTPETTAIAETAEALATLVREGKVRHIGISNETPWGLSEWLRVAEQDLAPRIVSIQNPYSLLNRSFEVGLAEMAIREDCGLLAYSPLAFGVLTGKYRKDAKPAGARLTLFERFSRYSNAQALAATDAYCKIAEDAGLSPAQMALAFVNQQPFVTSNLIGATTMAQLEENLASAKLQLPDDVLAAIAEVHQRHPDPAP